MVTNMPNILYSYRRDRKRRPVVTRCLLYTDRGLCIGQAFCHSKEQPVKKTGKNIALARAMTAASMSINTVKLILLRGEEYALGCGITCPKKPVFSLSPAELRWADRQAHDGT